MIVTKSNQIMDTGRCLCRRHLTYGDQSKGVYSVANLISLINGDTYLEIRKGTAIEEVNMAKEVNIFTLLNTLISTQEIFNIQENKVDT